MESVSLDEDSTMDLVSTRAMVERNMRNRPETIDAKQEVEMAQVEDEAKDKVKEFLLNHPVMFDCINALLHQDLWWWGMGSELMHKVEVTM